jgi:type I restriction enzyme S subunit
MRIDEIFSFEKGILQSSKCVPGDFDFITASSDWKTHNEYTHDCEALIFAAAASGSLGRTHYVNGKFVSSDLCFIITPKDQENLPVDLKFYHILFNELKDEIVRNTKAGTSKEAIGLGNFGKYELPYFDIDIQIEIKNQFVNSEEIKSSLTTELNQQVDLVKKLRQQLLQDAVQGKLVEQNPKDEPASELIKKIKAEKQKLIAEKKLKKEKELPPIKPEEIPFDIPENWVWCRLGEITEIQRGSSPRPKGDSRYFSKVKTDFNWITISDISDYCQDSVLLETREHLTEEGSKHSRYVEADEFIIAVSGSTTGKCCITGINGFIYDGLAVAKIINRGLMSRFLLNYMISLYSKINDSKSGASFPNINTEYLNKLLLPLPSQAEQYRIVQKVNELMQHCNDLEASIKQSESQNEKLLQQVLREALRKEPTIEND